MATNPSVIDPEDLRRAQMAQSFALQPPPPMQQQMPQGTDLGIPPPQQPAPKINAPRGTLQGDQAERSRLEMAGPVSSQVYKRITDSNFGQNHPTLGKILGGVSQGAATLGDVGLSAVAPSLAINLPGTAYHHAMELHGLNRDIGQESEEQQRAAGTQAEQGRTSLEAAQTAAVPGEAAEKEKLEDAQIANLLHPQAKTDFEAWRQQNPDAPVQDWLKAQNQSKAVNPKQDLQRQLVAAQNSGDTGKVKTLTQQLKDIDPEGQQRISITEQGQQNAVHRASDAATEREYAYTRNKWDKDLGTYQSQNEKLNEAEGFIGKGALGDALGSIKSLSGLASGQGSGVRITQAELNSIAQSRGLGGDFQAALQKFGDGRKLTPDQEKNLRGILEDVQHVAAAKEQVLNKGLDDLSNATDPKTIRKIDSQLRHVLMGGQ